MGKDQLRFPKFCHKQLSSVVFIAHLFWDKMQNSNNCKKQTNKKVSLQAKCAPFKRGQKRENEGKKKE